MDVTEEGVLLMGEEPFLEGDCITFNMILPTTFNGDEKVELQAKCQWTKRSKRPRLFEAGFRFVDVPTNVHDTLKKLIERFGMQENLDHEGRPSEWPVKTGSK